jgi:adenine-specific DNA-methyltransferase
VTTNALDSLLGRVDDAALRLSIEREVEQLRDTKDFGLVFERHLPERVRLLSHPIKRGVQVQDRMTESEETWVVASIKGGVATLIDSDGSESKRGVDELVVIRGFGDPIYPGLASVGKIERGGNKPFHAVIKGENFYVLETLLYAHEGEVDCIYIDPPYNSGARDWKYNNDYVDGDDAYRHSKWLSFMEKRLQLAKRLLNPENSVLIVTIDEKEYLRLGLLLEQVFSNGRITMVTSSISAGGASRSDTFGRSAEYIYFIQFGDSRVTPLKLDTEWNAVKTANKKDIRWALLLRSGTNATRAHRPNQFYPVFVKDTPDGPVFHSVGETLLDAPPTDDVREECVAVWPIRQDGSEGNWQVSAELLRKHIQNGVARLGQWKGSNTTIYYLKRGEAKKVADGVFSVTGHRADGSVITDSENYDTTFVPTDIWRLTSHDAGNSGSRLLSKFIPSRAFPFPKSLYAVEDSLRFFVNDKPNALIVDFFGGSGTTTHAVARLNHRHGGSRRSIVVTNNEVSDVEAKALRKAGHFPGQPEWEALGIFEHITRPRITAAVTGNTPGGIPVAGDYKFTDEFPMAEGFEENVEFFELTYMDKDAVARGKAFEAIAPVLWMRFGAGGAQIAKQTKTYAAPAGARYAVLFDVTKWQPFVDAIRERDDLLNVCIVTDSIAQFQQVVAELPEGVGATMLYEDYLRNFEINTGISA